MITQLGIFFFGGMAVYLVSSIHHDTRRWAYVLGLCSQPFWFYSAYQAEQWGIFALCAWYTVAWGKGAYNHWIDVEG